MRYLFLTLLFLLSGCMQAQSPEGTVVPAEELQDEEALGEIVSTAEFASLGEEEDYIESEEKPEQVISSNARLISELRARGANVREIPRGVVVTLPDALFAFNSDKLTGKAMEIIARISEVMFAVQGRAIAIEGHTDAVGSLQYNQRLSERRSKAVVDALVSRGVSRARLQMRGFGEVQPITTNRTDEGRTKNRRVEIVFENQ